MGVTIGIPRETFPSERRVALTPRHCEALAHLVEGSKSTATSAQEESGY